MPHKIILDTDPGIDDAIALYLALRSPEIEVIGLTTVFGNHTTETTTRNALSLLEIAGRAAIPVARGAEHPLVGEYHLPQFLVHGADGQGNVNLPAPSSRPIDQTAAAFIIEQAMKYSGEVTLVQVGPLTNLALALRLEPRLTQHIKEVVLMGGSAFDRGNITPAAEANIHKDPEAAEMVFNAGWQVTMVGLDVTRKVIMSDTDFARLQAADNPLAKHLSAIIPYYLSIYTSRQQSLALHDPTAIAYVIQPELFQTVDCAMRVELTGLGRGKTWAVEPDRIWGTPEFAPWRNRPPVNICVEVDGAAVAGMVLGRLI